MRKLRTTLDDGNVYMLSTLTLKEQGVARRLESLPKEELDEMTALSEKMDEDKELTEEEKERMADLQDKQMNQLVKIVLLSLAKNHDEFKITENRTEEAVLDSIKGLIDIRDLKRYSNFALLGTLPIEEDEEYMVEEIIDLTAPSTDEE